MMTGPFTPLHTCGVGDWLARASNNAVVAVHKPGHGVADGKVKDAWLALPVAAPAIVTTLGELTAWAGAGLLTQPCADCNGTGKGALRCSDCDGTGEHTVTCHDCDDEHEHECRACKGDGEHRGKGAETCSECKGAKIASARTPGMLAGVAVDKHLLGSVLAEVTALPDTRVCVYATRAVEIDGQPGSALIDRGDTRALVCGMRETNVVDVFASATAAGAT